jgi:hypothetical protein
MHEYAKNKVVYAFYLDMFQFIIIIIIIINYYYYFVIQINILFLGTLLPLLNPINLSDNAVGIATGYGLDDQGVGVPSPGESKNFHFSMSSLPALGPTQPPIQLVPGLFTRG